VELGSGISSITDVMIMPLLVTEALFLKTDCITRM
jgi:hypothetical protein